jgi:hypothetical protein
MRRALAVLALLLPTAAHAIGPQNSNHAAPAHTSAAPSASHGIPLISPQERASLLQQQRDSQTAAMRGLPQPPQH